MFLARAKNDNNNDRIYLESNSKAVARNLESGDLTKYFLIKMTANATTLQPVTLKGGIRRDGRKLEVAEIIADGNTVGQVEIEK